jgi:glycosyltransferase involved in cell wall biosynthesis
VTERLRIAVLSRNFATTGGGAERYSIAIVEHLAARHEVHVFAQNIAHDFPGVTYHRVPMPFRKPRWINQLVFAWSTWRATRQGFDIVHSHENTWHGNVQTVHVLPVKHTLFAGKQGAALALRWLKVVTSPRLLAYLWLEKARFAFAYKKRVVASSLALSSVLAKTFPKTAPMLEVATPGVDGVPGPSNAADKLAARAALGLPSDGALLLFVGNDFAKKGLAALLSALPTLDAHVHLAVVGRAEAQAATERQVEAAGLSQRVHFLGSLGDMSAAYRAADMLVHPTREDSYGMVVLEALSHGLPVVVSSPAYCGIAADLSDGENAVLLTDPTSNVEVAEAIQKVLGNAGFFGSVSQGAMAFAAQHSWHQAALSYEALYLQIARKFRQRWLVLSHAFNMDGRAASQTITDKLPHLEAAGIELVILSGVSGRKDTHYEHYQLWPAGAAGIRFELRHVLRKHLTSPVAYRTVMLLVTVPLFPFMLIEKLLRSVESSWSWWFSAYLKGRGLARQHKFDWIYSTGGAFAAHLAGRALEKSLGVPWLAEVHDPLVMPGSMPSTAQELMQAEVERLICTEASVAIWFTDQALASARRRHPQLANRGKMVLPGVDAPFTELPPYVPGSKLRIGHFGSLSSTRNLGVLIEAFELLRVQYPELAVMVELHVYGGPLDPVSSARLQQSSVRHMVRHFGRVEADSSTGESGRMQILRLMRSMDVLLLLHGTEPICAEYIPSKLYEYFWMQRPILALVHDNPQMARLIQRQGHHVLNTEQHADIVALELAEQLQKMYVQFATQGLPDQSGASPFTTKNAVQQVVQWIAAPSAKGPQSCSRC